MTKIQIQKFNASTETDSARTEGLGSVRTGRLADGARTISAGAAVAESDFEPVVDRHEYNDR